MQASDTSKTRSRWIQRGLIIVAAVALLGGAAYVWGNRLRADTTQANTQAVAQSPAYTAASRYSSLQGMAAVRAADNAASQRSSLRGVAAVRASELAAHAASSAQKSSLRGVAAVRAAEQTANSAAQPQSSAAVWVQSNLELRRASSDAQRLNLQGVAAVRASE